ncbi:MAG: gas vesicle protein GvpJ [Thermodesulfovibrionales bacterium]|nr:gas vesicle protein GvpJ [Thermodesulfovibrionales bacterium]
MSGASPSRNVSLVETLDRVIDKGVVLSGDLMLSVADVDLVFVGLRVMIASVDTAEKMRGATGSPVSGARLISEKRCLPETGTQQHEDRPNRASLTGTEDMKGADAPEKVEQGLAKLVLTVVELIRQLMEKQALRRIDRGSVTDEEAERLGAAFMKLEDKMQELKEIFGLKDEDLNLNLGPLGDLI